MIAMEGGEPCNATYFTTNVKLSCSFCLDWYVVGLNILKEFANEPLSRFWGASKALIFINQAPVIEVNPYYDIMSKIVNLRNILSSSHTFMILMYGFFFITECLK